MWCKDEKHNLSTGHILPQFSFTIGPPLHRSDLEFVSRPIPKSANRHNQITMLLNLLPILALFLTLAHAAALANPFAKPDTSALEKRACVYDGCECDPAAHGQYCGYCPSVRSCTMQSCYGDVYQCGPGGSCCKYGPRDSCQIEGGPCG
ncbi:hypothetical protein HOY82DRAFT_557525 [Tuber indicum]|nr:hypothetical protein HOY82DRAFT_557525 [Tuber indicum]